MGRRKGGQRRDSVRSSAGVREADVSDDEVDAFHEQRDRILFDDDTGSKRAAGRSSDPYDALDDRRGVLDIVEADSDIGSDEGEDETGDYDEEEEEEEDDVALLPTAASKKKKSSAQQARYEQESDDDDDDDEGQDGVEDGEPSIVGGWGSNKRAYYNTNDLEDLGSDSEMDEDERREMELREVKKIQQRIRQGMTDEDFGLGVDAKVLEGEAGRAAREQRRRELNLDQSIEATRHAVANVQPLNPAELIAKVQRETPEAMALVGEFADMVEEMNAITNRMKELQDSDPDHPSLGLIHLHHQTLLTYVTTLTFYFYVRASPDESRSLGKRVPQSAIIERLAKLKTGLSALEDFGLGKEASDDEEDDDEEELEGESEPVSFLFKPRSMFQEDSSEEESQSLGSLEDDELMQLDAEEKENISVSPKKASQGATSNGTKKQKGKEGRKNASASTSKSQRQQKAPLAALADLAHTREGEQDDDDDDDDIDDTLAPPSKRRKQRSVPANSASFDLYGEPTALDEADMADKEATRRSLKFHTGQLEAQPSSSRKLDGDVDIPYRDKERSRMAVAAANANRTAKANGLDSVRRQLDEDEFGEEDARDWRDVMDAEGDIGEYSQGDGETGDYYDLITNARKSAKRADKESYDAERLAQRVAPSDALEEGEHRAIDRTIEKNRGLTPRRPKASRNPRVKKRLRYEKAQKKLSSRGPVYKGGQSSLQGGYGGEASGINSHVVKSRQFA